VGQGLLADGRVRGGGHPAPRRCLHVGAGAEAAVCYRFGARPVLQRGALRIIAAIT